VKKTRRLVPLALLVAALAVAPGCTVTGDGPLKTREPAATTSSAPAGDFDPTAGTAPELERFYTQTVDWTECGPDIECGLVQVPMDYDVTDGVTITIAVNRLKTAGSGAPDLFLNPGGPGGSGTGMLEWIKFSVSDRLSSEYNLVGFDPRGVNDSDAVDCITDAEMDAWRAQDVDTSTDAGLAAYAAEMEVYGKRCAENTGELLGHLDTDNAARDLDVLRAVVGRTDTLDYLGYSYGTFLGAVYADLFTERVGRFTLDGAIDPALSISGLGLGQAAGFENALRTYMADCQSSADCPFAGSVDDGLAQVRQLLDVVRATPLPTDDPNRPLTYPLALSGIILPMYESSIWPQLSLALDSAINDNDGTELLYWADLGAGRQEDGTYDDNSNEAFMAINCLDYPVEGTLADWRADAAKMTQVSPTLRDALAYTEITCDAWPYDSVRTRGPIAAAGSAPILVVGTTGDPATPYQWAVSMADELEQGHLLTWEGNGHTAYGRSNQCVTDAVDEYMITGALPEDGATC